jgi:hypothetical protein
LSSFLLRTFLFHRKAVKHPQLGRIRGVYVNDVGLLFVDMPASGSIFGVRAICLSNLELPFQPPDDPLLLGWGVDTHGRRSEALKHVPIRYVSQS